MRQPVECPGRLCRSLFEYFNAEKRGDFTLITQAYDTSNSTRCVLQVSTDRGEHWTRVGKGLPSETSVNAIVADPARPNVVFAGTEGRGVYRSVDGGATWVPSRRRR